nr:MAG TPA: hypothetical protein [Bacteriophage sp.]
MQIKAIHFLLLLTFAACFFSFLESPWLKVPCGYDNPAFIWARKVFDRAMKIHNSQVGHHLTRQKTINANYNSYRCAA